jgi:hypothetical protein
MGKGSTRRQPQIDDKTLTSNWDVIFKKKEPEKFRLCPDCGQPLHKDLIHTCSPQVKDKIEQPIGWIAQNAIGDYYFRLKKPDDVYKPFPVFKPKQWVGLTEEDKQIAFDDTQEGGSFWDFAEAIEATLRRKNEFR